MSTSIFFWSEVTQVTTVPAELGEAASAATVFVVVEETGSNMCAQWLKTRKQCCCETDPLTEAAA